MNLKKVIHIYDIIKERLPKTYPRPKLAFYEDEQCMLANTRVDKKEDEIVQAVVTPNTFTINLPMKVKVEFITKTGQYVYKEIPIGKHSDKEIALTLLHELAHLYAGEKFGYGSLQYSNEKYCDGFALRWVKKLLKEKLI